MSDRTTLKNLDAAPEHESSQLSELRASKDLASKPENSDLPLAPATDLSQISIAAAGVERLSARPGKRIIRLGHQSASATERSAQGASPKARSTGEVGVFKNPYYPYQGNALDRFVALIANICKVLEKLLLKLIGGGDAPIPKHAPKTTQAKKDSPSEQEQEKKKQKEREAKQRELSTNRS
jgi:hypothetical protein